VHRLRRLQDMSVAVSFCGALAQVGFAGAAGVSFWHEKNKMDVVA